MEIEKTGTERENRTRRFELPKTRRGRLIPGGGALGVAWLLFIMYNVLTPGPTAVAAQPLPAPTPALPPVLQPEVPAHYLSEHFRDELAACYRATGQPRSSPEMERAIEEAGQAASVAALTDQYRAGTCPEPGEFLRIPGRALWMHDAINDEADN